MVVFPKLEVLAFTLIAGHLVKDTQIGCVVVRTKLLYDLGQESHLLLSQEFRTLCGVEIEDKAILLGIGLKQFVRFGTVLNRLTKVVDLVLLERGDESALVLVEDKFGDELSYSHDVEELYDVDLFIQFVCSILVSLQTVQATLVTG